MFRRKLQRVPLELDYPYWVEDENFDLEYHVRHIALPKPGDWRQFCIQASRIHARPLDLNRPLWEIYVIEGLDSLARPAARQLRAADQDRTTRRSTSSSGSEITMLLHDISRHAAGAPTPPAPWFPEARAGRASACCARRASTRMLSPLRAGRAAGARR